LALMIIGQAAATECRRRPVATADVAPQRQPPGE